MLVPLALLAPSQFPARAPSRAKSVNLLQPESVVGANPNAGISSALDTFYAVGALAVVALAARSVFDSIFVENISGDAGIYSDSIKLPFTSKSIDPIEEAEDRRRALQAAVERGDFAEALKREKELKQWMMENGIVYEFDEVVEDSDVDGVL